MGKFDGILLLSDWDRTLYWNDTIPENNLTAIRYFQERGGLFAFASGRLFNFLKQFEDKIRANTYTLCCNGGMIVDPRDGRTVYEGFCDDKLYDLLDRAFALDCGYHTVCIYFADDPDNAGVIWSKEEYFAQRDRLNGRRARKALLITDTTENGTRGAEAVQRWDLGEYFAARSWEVSLEFMKKECSKGASLLRAKKLSDAKIAIAVGDYENDISMLETADIGYAVENAIDSVKAAADRVTVHCKDGAIAAIIRDIEQEIDSGTFILP